MLKDCPECSLPVSEKALACPHCGFPFSQISVYSRPKKPSNKRRRLPNGFGQISEIKDHYLRKPFRVMVPAGKTEDGKPISKLLKPEAYFATYNEAYQALMNYNQKPYESRQNITVEELYQEWRPKHAKTYRNENSISIMDSAWNYCSSVYKMPFSSLRPKNIRECLDNGTFDGKKTTASLKKNIKGLFNMLYDYAIEQEITDTNYARMMDLKSSITAEDRDSRVNHIPFTEDELAILWQNISMPMVDTILIQCYMGWRPNEILKVKLTDIDLENWNITGGSKTEAGKDRIVPVHSCIRELILNKYKQSEKIGSEYLVQKKGEQLAYIQYSYAFKKVISNLGLNLDHKPHDPRKTFITLCKKYQADEYAIKYMVGHVIADLTEKVYTEREITWLHDEVEKIRSRC